MSGSPIVVGSNISLQEFVDDFVLRYHHEFFPVVDSGRILGSVGLEQLRAIPRDAWKTTTVGNVFVPISDGNAIEAQVGAMAALRTMQRQKVSRLMVLDGGILVGILAWDLLKSLSLEVTLRGGPLA
jgi:predicted transcriptional regulator